VVREREREREGRGGQQVFYGKRVCFFKGRSEQVAWSTPHSGSLAFHIKTQKTAHTASKVTRTKLHDTEVVYFKKHKHTRGDVEEIHVAQRNSNAIIRMAAMTSRRPGRHREEESERVVVVVVVTA